MKFKGLIFIMLMCLLLGVVACGGGGSAAQIERPSVGYIPPNWYLNSFEPYTEGWFGLFDYTDAIDGDFVMIWYSEIPAELEGQVDDPDALIDQAVAESIFIPDDTGTMIVAGQIAGYARAYDSTWDWWEWDIVFVSGSTYVDIYTIYDATPEDEADAMDLIDSISF